MSKLGLSSIATLLALVLPACSTDSGDSAEYRGLDTGDEIFDVARIASELCGDGLDNDGDGLTDEDCGVCDDFASRDVLWWAYRGCVIDGDANGIDALPLTIGTAETYTSRSAVTTVLRGTSYSNEAKLRRQLLVTSLNAAHFDSWDTAVVDWDEDGVNETVAWLWNRANTAYLTGSDWSKGFWAAQLRVVNQAGEGADLWFDPTCEADPTPCTEEPEPAAELQCEAPTECLSIHEAHALGIVALSSAGDGEEVVLTNLSDTLSVCLDEQVVYTSDGTQAFFWDQQVVSDGTEVGPGESFSAWYGSWTTDNGTFAPFLGEDAWWCLQFNNPINGAATFDYAGEIIPEAIAELVLSGRDSDGDTVDDLLDWVAYGGVQAQYDIWSYQEDHAVLTAGKVAQATDCGIEVSLTVRNLGELDGSGTLTDTIPAGWTLESASVAPDSTTVEGDGSTTLTWEVAVDGMDGADVFGSQIVYSISYDAGLDLGKVDLPGASIAYDDSEGAETSYSLPGVAFDVDLDCDGEVSCDEDELCDGLDNDHDGETDEGFVDTDEDGTADCVDTEECDGLDNDGDGYFDEGFDADGDGLADCFDTEECDGLDNDGDGSVDEGFDADDDGVADCFDVEECDGLDNDGDGYFDEGFDADGDGLADCFDTEECDGVDNDGDGSVDEGFDSDADGVADCFDTEECDGVDNDGDGSVDEGFDADGDGTADCFDTEECDGVDNDGDGSVDEGFDSDADGVADCFDTEECDGVDNDGDGSVDEGFDSDDDGVADCFDTEECDGVDNDGDGSVDEGFDADGDGLGDCLDTEECDGLDNDGDGLVDEDNVCGDGFCDPPPDCLTVWQAHSLDLLLIESDGFGEQIVATNLSDELSICLDEQVVYTSDDSQGFFWDFLMISSAVELAPGDSHVSYYGSYTTDNGTYTPHLGDDAWWCLQIDEPVGAGAVFDYFGEGVPDGIAQYGEAGWDTDGEGTEDQEQWIDWRGVQGQYNIWDYQEGAAALTIGKVANFVGPDVEVSLRVRNFGEADGTGAVTDSVPAGWTLTGSTPSATATTEGDGSTTLDWSVSVDGMDGVTIDGQTITYTMSYDAGTDLGYLELDVAGVAFDSIPPMSAVSLSLPAAVYNLDIDGDGTLECPDEVVVVGF